jgi:hypothetical protein
MRARILTTIVLWLILVMAVACGTAESPDPTAAPGAEPTAVATTGDTSQPTAVPQETAPVRGGGGVPWRTEGYGGGFRQ